MQLEAARAGPRGGNRELAALDRLHVTLSAKRIAPLTHRDAPMRDRARGVAREHALEQLRSGGRLDELRRRWSQALMDVAGCDATRLIALDDVNLALTRLAAAGIDAAMLIARRELARRYGELAAETSVAILGLGRLGSGGMAVIGFTDPEHPRDLYAVNLRNAGNREAWTRLTRANPWVESVQLARTETVREPRDRIIAIGAGYPGCVCNRGSATGEASWYHRNDGPTAAHRTLPLGTVVRVENLANGKWVNVTIRDRGPFVQGRIIDLSDDAFRRLASLSTGVIDVRIRW